MIFSTIGAANPEAADKLIESFNDDDRSHLCIAVSRFHLSNQGATTQEDIQLLMALVHDREADFLRRGEAMGLLCQSKLTDDDSRKFIALLVAEAKNPQEGRFHMNTRGSAVSALSKMTAARDHLELLLSLEDLRYSEFASCLEALRRHIKDEDEFKTRMSRFVSDYFNGCKGMVNDVFLACLTHDLRELREMAMAHASANPEVPDGDRAGSYSDTPDWSAEEQRYHMAREVLALWLEEDPETLARMWACFVAAHPGEFPHGQPASSTPAILRDLAAHHLQAIPPEPRRRAIRKALDQIEIHPGYQPVGDWLSSLGD